MNFSAFYIKMLEKIQEKETIGVLNIFTLTSPNKLISQKIKDEQVSSVNRLAELGCIFATAMLINNVISYGKGSSNAAFTLPNGALNVLLTLIWIVLKYRFSKFPNYLYVVMIAAEAIWINLGIRGLLPEGVKLDVVDYRTLIDSL